LPGPSRSARLRAQSLGYPAPAQWRGRDINNPTARPRSAAELLAPAGDAGDDPWAAAVCRSVEHDPDLWHRNEQQAMRLCTPCPLRRACLRAALVRDEPDGVWGGLTQQQRGDLRRALMNQLGEDEPLDGSVALERAVTTFGARLR
jgi:WhiB family redox-sensing transcriptional regulator